MYRDLQNNYWWTNIKREIATYVSNYLVCQQVEAEHQRPAGLLNPLPILKWKWEHICMDFFIGRPRTQKNNDAIWVIVDSLSKSAHFIPFRTRMTLKTMAKIYIDQIIKYHGIPTNITYNKDSRFMSYF